jgi:hypothetical protein
VRRLAASPAGTNSKLDLVPALSTRAAIYSGIIATEIEPLPVSCGAANCTWPTTPSLAVCGECTSVYLTGGCDAGTKVCNYTTPSGNSASIPSDEGGHGVFKVAPSKGSHNEINKTNRAYISIFDVLQVSRFSGEPDATWAYECSLSFCVQAFSIIVEGGRQKQKIIGNWTDTRVEYPSSSHSTEYVFEDIPSQFNVKNGTQFIVEEIAMIALRNFVTPLLSGTVNSDVLALDYSSDWIEAMWNATSNLSSWISTLALSMSNEVRLQGHGDADYAGYATLMTPFVHVRWFWMFYFATLIMGSIYYLCMIMTQAARDGVSAWKGDSLPMLFCQIDRGIHGKVKNGMDVPGGLEDRVGQTEVSLERDASTGEWIFRTPESAESAFVP